MKICTVIGQVVANSKHPLLEGQKIMVVKAEGEDGGMQVEYDDENPLVLDLFEEDCLKHGAMPDMRRYFPNRTEFKIQLPNA